MAAIDIRRVCVIGAGSAGLGAVKNLLEYGIEVVCYEKSNDITGIWKYKDSKCDGLGTVMKSTVLNTSKEFISLSDYPTSKEHANYMRHDEVYKFMKSYAKHFNLDRHIQLETEVVEVKRALDYSETGRWQVVSSSKGLQRVETFDAVMVCTGHDVHPHIPVFDGLENFKGTVIHSHDYKTARPYYDRRVLVVGLGNSGGDVLCEVGKVAKQTLGCSRNGTWVSQRVSKNGYPRDILKLTRYRDRLQRMMPAAIRHFLAIREYNERIDHNLYGIHPNANPENCIALTADDLPLHLASGWVQLRVGIHQFTANGVYFQDGSYDEIDDVIFCTGYDFDFKWIEEGGAVPVEDNQTRLWRRIFPPDHKNNTLAMIGVIDPIGPTITCCEMQSRVVAHYWANRIPLPSQETMNAEIEEERAETMRRFKCTPRKASLRMDHIHYFDQLAAMIGCRPDLSWTLFLSDPLLALQLHLGPVTSHQYRLRGPKRWPAAREHLLGTYDRVHYGMNTRLRKEVHERFDEKHPTVLLNLLPIVAKDLSIVLLFLLAFVGLLIIF